jgi:hypothetical protein
VPRIALAVVVALALAPAARATPPAGATLPAVTVDDQDGKPRALPDRRIPVIIIYEDAKAGPQNARASNLIDKISDNAANKKVVEALPVADLGKWNWWPARHFALAEVKRIATKERTTIYCDWTAAVRKSWQLKKGLSGILVLDTDGKVRFAGEGPLTDRQIHELLVAVQSLGAWVPDPAAVTAKVKHEQVKQEIPEEVKQKVPEARE